MSASRQFVDTNVLVYAHDRTAGPKRDSARALVESLWESGQGCVSVQVLEELFVTVTRKVPMPLSSEAGTLLVRDFARWRVHSPTADDVLFGIDIHRRHGVSLWDAMIVSSAGRLGCDVVYSEDLSATQDYDGVRVVNPFS